MVVFDFLDNDGPFGNHDQPQNPTILSPGGSEMVLVNRAKLKEKLRACQENSIRVRELEQELQKMRENAAAANRQLQEQAERIIELDARAETDSQLKLREDICSENEANIAAREESCSRRELLAAARENAIMEVCSREIHESRQNAGRQLDSVYKELYGIRNQFEAAYKQLGAVNQMVSEVSKLVTMTELQPALKKLCSLHRSLSQAAEACPGNAVLLWGAAELKRILIAELGAEEIRPEIGNAFDGEKHEKKDYSNPGMTIAAVLNAGWACNGSVLMPALVDVRSEYHG